MVTALIVLTSIIVFLVAIVSPYYGTRIQMRSRRLLRAIERRTKHKPHLVKLTTNMPTAVAHWLVHHAAAAGKKSRWKLPF